MLAEFTSNIGTMSQGQFGLLLLVLTVFTGFGFFLWKKSFQHARVMEDMPTSKVRSAAQGFVELSGIQHALEGAPLSAPLTGSACTWWDYKIEKRERTRNSKGQSSTRWVTKEKQTSVGFFNLKDDTGEILVNPIGADVTPSLQRVWYGNERRPNSGVRSGFGGSLRGRYRYTERIMRPGEPIYALGHFETWSNVAGSREKTEKHADILAGWKKDADELVRRFDEDGDGRVDADEWESAREAAQALVEEQVAAATMKPDVDVLMKPEEDHPFILSTKSQDELTKVYRWKAVGGLLLFLVGLAAVAVTLNSRLG